MATPVKYLDSEYYVEFYVKASAVAAADTNVPIPVRLTSEIISLAHRADGLDIVVTDVSGELIPREIVNFSVTSSTGIVWVRVPVLSPTAGGTVLYLQFGGASVNVPNSTQVWANTHGGNKTWSLVCHAAGNVNDSSPTGNHGTFNGSAQYGTTSQFGYEAIQVAGDNDYTSFPHNANLRGGNGTTDNPITIVVWAKPTNYANSIFFVKGSGSATIDYDLMIHSTKKLYFQCFDGSESNRRGRYQSTAIDDTGQWRHYAGTYSGTTPADSVRIYRDGTRVDDTQISAGNYTAMDGDSDVLSIGRYSSTYGSFAWCEFRIGQFALSADQIATSYTIESQVATNGALTVGGVEQFPAGVSGITLSYLTNKITIDYPEYGYVVRIDPPWDMAMLDTGIPAIYDHGDSGQYDRRSCVCEFVLDKDDTEALIEFLTVTARGKDIILSGDNDSGFYPFGPDWGGQGEFTVRAELLSAARRVSAPMGYYRVRVRFVNVGTKPTYSSQIAKADGVLDIGSVTGIRMPVNWYAPDSWYGERLAIVEGGSARTIDRTSLASRWSTELDMVETTAKMAELIEYLLTVRTGNISMSYPAGHAPWGIDAEGQAEATVRIAQTSFELVAVGHNIWRMQLRLVRVP